MKVLALNINGDITYCTVSPENRGKGRCNHVEHQRLDESPQEFLERVENFKPEESSNFIPYEGTEIKTKPYRMTEEEKEDLIKIESRMQLDQNIEGGYISLKEPLWNDMDKNYFSNLSGIQRKNIDAVLHEESSIILDSDNSKYPVGKIVDNDLVEKLSKDSPELVENIYFATGVTGLNQFSKEVYNWEATKDIYVLPYYMRIGANKNIEEEETWIDEDADLEEREDPNIISSDITIGYKYLLRQHKNPNNQQLAYEALLNNSAMSREKARYNSGYRNKSLADEFVGKGGVFRACLSGSSIPYSARAVVTPELMPYGEIKIPPSMAIDIFRPTLLKQFASEDMSEGDIDRYFQKYRKPQTEIDPVDRLDLELRISDRRVAMNRQPSLHTSSFQSFRPKVSPDSTVKVHPLYCESYGMDFDGDCVSIYGFNQDRILPVLDRSIAAENDVNTHKPRNVESSSILPSKDALWGLLNVLDKRSE